MKSKWASCSSDKNISLNTQMKYLPNNLIRYIIHHEYTHLKINKHNKRFWEIVSREYPNYKEKENDLFTYWFLIQEYNKD